MREMRNECVRSPPQRLWNTAACSKLQPAMSRDGKSMNIKQIRRNSRYVQAARLMGEVRGDTHEKIYRMFRFTTVTTPPYCNTRFREPPPHLPSILHAGDHERFHLSPGGVQRLASSYPSRRRVEEGGRENVRTGHR